MPIDPLVTLGEKVKAERLRQRYSVQAAAKAAKVARDTWKRVEAGEGVHDTTRRAVLDLLGLDWYGEPSSGVVEPPTNWADEARILLAEKRELERQLAELKAERDSTA